MRRDHHCRRILKGWQEWYPALHARARQFCRWLQKKRAIQAWVGYMQCKAEKLGFVLMLQSRHRMLLLQQYWYAVRAQGAVLCYLPQPRGYSECVQLTMHGSVGTASNWYSSDEVLNSD